MYNMRIDERADESAFSSYRKIDTMPSLRYFADNVSKIKIASSGLIEDERQHNESCLLKPRDSCHQLHKRPT